MGDDHPVWAQAEGSAVRPGSRRSSRLHGLFAHLLALPAALAAAGMPQPSTAQIIINEYQSSNIHCLLDEDEDTPDWIELYNAGRTAVSLDHYGLSDQAANPYRWVFPKMVLPAGEFLLVYASGKDRRVGAGHWETVVSWGDPWRYRANRSAVPDGWREPGFDAGGWTNGPSGIGYGDDDDATVIPKCVSVSMRATFTVDDPSLVRGICLQIDYDDGFCAWLNGVEIARANLGIPGSPELQWDERPLVNHEAHIYAGGQPESHPLDAVLALLQPGSNVLAVEVHNAGGQSGDLSAIPMLSLGFDQAPPGARGTPDLIRLTVPHPHTNFRLDTAGELLLLHDSRGALVDSVRMQPLLADQSWGRVPDGGDIWLFMDESTPEAANQPGRPGDFTDAPQFSVVGGLCASPVDLELRASTPASKVYYTLDCAEPDTSAVLYTEPIHVAQTTIVRARAFAPGKLPSPTVTHSFILDEPTDLLVVSLVTDPVNLWDEQIGIYVLGPGADPSFPYEGANFWKDWERPVHFQFFAPDGGGFRAEGGVKIHGSNTRALPQRPLRLIARGGYGYPLIAYQAFSDKPIAAFKRLILRNSGNDWHHTYLRDALAHAWAGELSLDRQAWRPARVYLNGEYWGLYDLREKIDRFFLQENWGINPDNVDLLEDQHRVMEGDADNYMAMLDYIGSHDLSQDDVLAQVAAMMDVDNFAAYYILRVFLGNTDWPGNNIRYWRSREPGSRWRWILHDAEMGLGLNDEGYQHNTLAHALDPSSVSAINAPWSTFLMRSLLKNQSYRYAFINRYADCLNTLFLPESTLVLVEALKSQIEDEIPRQVERWGSTTATWEEQLANVRQFLRERPRVARVHLMEQFDLADTIRLTLDVQPAGSGRICLTACAVDSAWAGTYFAGVPLTLRAVPANHYRFIGWSDSLLPGDAEVVVTPTADYSLCARFDWDLPSGCRWDTAAPNPVSGEMHLTFTLDRAGRARIWACDVTGRVVATIADGPFARGLAELGWSGRDDRGRPLPSGVYLLRLEALGTSDSHRVLIVH
jgi:hypothetical protein